MTTIEAMRKAVATLDAIGDYDVRNMLPLPLWRDIMQARGALVAAVEREEAKGKA
jgi:hypothetical protein